MSVVPENDNHDPVLGMVAVLHGVIGTKFAELERDAEGGVLLADLDKFAKDIARAAISECWAYTRQREKDIPPAYGTHGHKVLLSALADDLRRFMEAV